MKYVFRAAVIVVGLWVVGVGLFFASMYRPPEEFARGVAALPRIVMPVIPFAPLWKIARAGTLDLGDPAPDFNLETLDRSSRVQLSSFRGVRPVVLVFGSYT